MHRGLDPKQGELAKRVAPARPVPAAFNIFQGKQWLGLFGRLSGFTSPASSSCSPDLCKDVGRPLLMTGAFAAEVGAPVFEIGHFELRGFRQHQSLYGLCQDGEVPAAPTWTDGA